MTKPTVSVIIPVYNAGSTVTEIVSSVLQQTFDDFELILVDDGSTDSTLNTLRGLKSQDKRIIVRSKKNGGPSSARNDGLTKSRGEYVVFFDADDDVDRHMLEIMVKNIEVHMADLAVCGWTVDTYKGEKLVKNSSKLSPKNRVLDAKTAKIDEFILSSIGNDGLLYNLWNKMYRRDIIEKHSIRFQEDIRFGEDLIFSLNYYKHIEKMVIIPNTLYRYRFGSESSTFSSSALNPKYRHMNNVALDEYVGASRSRKIDELTQWIKWRWLMSYYRLVADSNMPRSKKIDLIKQAPSDGLSLAKNSSYIGKKKLALERLGKLLVKSPRSALLFGSSAQTIKNINFSVKK